MTNITATLSAMRDRYIAWSEWASTSAAWQDYFRGEDDDPLSLRTGTAG